MVITLKNQKGGVGKTTLSVHLAHGLTIRKRRVLLVDADSQGSASDWAAARENEPLFPVIGMDRPTLHKELSALAGDYQDVIIDGPPRIYDIARSAMLAADLVLLPVTPSPYDVWAAEESISLIKEAQIFKDELKAAFVINRKIANTAIGRDVNDALAQYEVPILNSMVCQRVVFAEAAAAGMTAMELGLSSPASREIFRLVDEILA
ncbi:MAG: ParA family partition ATPase [Pseudomonadota bacterium]